MMPILTIPYPPSGNHAVKHARNGRHYIDARTRAYREVIARLVQATGNARHLSCPLKVELAIVFPDNRRRDLDNVAKTALDALTLAGVWVDDHLIHDLRLIRAGVSNPASVEVTFRRIP